MPFILISLLGLFLVSCRTTGPGASEQQSTIQEFSQSPQQISDQVAWNAYVAETLEAYEVQGACRPASFQHQGELKGLAILFHGFTACPQQYFDIAQKLQAQGWDVLLPLSPGHGMQRNLKIPEQSQLPSKDNYAALTPAFIKRINAIARAHPAEQKLVGGLSLGGAYATAAIAYDPTLYTRGLIMTPLYRMSAFMANIVGGANNIDDFNQKINPETLGALSRRVLNMGLGWGAGCEQENARGRQGICKFDFTHLIAAQQFGYELSANQNIQGQLQFVAVEGDMAVDGGRIKWFFENKVLADSSQKRLCFYRRPANHSLASRYDRPEENKFWLPAFETDLVNFVTQGTFFSTSPEQISGYHACRSD